MSDATPSGPGGLAPLPDVRDIEIVAGMVPGEFAVEAMTSGQLIRRRFLHHRAAMTSLVLLGFVVLLAYSSIGVAGIPGWWGKGYQNTGQVLDGGRMTLDLLPSFVDGDGLALGEHPFGQDNTGIDYFALTMRGAQESLMIAFVVGLVSTTIGVLVGASAGYLRGRTEAVLMRVTDLFIAVPYLITAAVVSVKFGESGGFVLAVTLGCVLWVQLARLLRGEFLSLREKEFVEAARALGASGPRIVFRHLIPNAIGTIIVNATLTISAAILLETALSYVGLGVKPPDSSLGSLISVYQNASQTRPWLFWWPGLFIVVIALTVNFIGDGLRDAFDPRQRRVRA